MRGLLGALLVLSFGLVIFPGWGAAYIGVLLFGGAIVFILMGKGPPSRYLARLDDLVYEGERVLVTIALVVMSVLVFIDVVWSTAHNTDPATAKAFLTAIFVLCMLGGFTARRETSASTGKKIASGLIAYVVLMVLGALIYIVPNGFGWSQRVALCLILWVGLLGGSMATHDGRHIAVDAVRRVVPAHLQRKFELAAGVVTVSLLAVLTVLAVRYARDNWHEWIESEMTAGIFESLPIPYWAATISVPIGFGIMTMRFVKVALHGRKESDLLESLGAAGDASGDGA